MDYNTLTSYCERLTGTRVFYEPLNTWSNVAFLIAGLFMILETKNWSLSKVLLTFFTFVTGLGSALLHVYGEPWGRWLDVFPLVSWIIVFIGAFYSALALGPWIVLSIYALFFAINFGFLTYVDHSLVANSNYYFGTLLLSAIATYQVWVKGSVATKKFVGATVLFIASLTLRALDLPLCKSFPLGTHFMWHIFNAVVMYLLYIGLLDLKTEHAISSAAIPD